MYYYFILLYLFNYCCVENSNAYNVPVMLQKQTGAKDTTDNVAKATTEDEANATTEDQLHIAR
jgi:hypothetical protein